MEVFLNSLAKLYFVSRSDVTLFSARFPPLKWFFNHLNINKIDMRWNNLITFLVNQMSKYKLNFLMNYLSRYKITYASSGAFAEWQIRVMRSFRYRIFGKMFRIEFFWSFIVFRIFMNTINWHCNRCIFNNQYVCIWNDVIFATFT